MAECYYDDEVYEVSDYMIDELACGYKPHEIVSRFEGIDMSWDYMYFSIYGVEEWNGIETNGSYRDVAVWILDDYEDCGYANLSELLEEFDEEDLEEE